MNRLPWGWMPAPSLVAGDEAAWQREESCQQGIQASFLGQTVSMAMSLKNDHAHVLVHLPPSLLDQWQSSLSDHSPFPP